MKKKGLVLAALLVGAMGVGTVSSSCSRRAIKTAPAPPPPPSANTPPMPSPAPPTVASPYPSPDGFGGGGGGAPQPKGHPKDGAGRKARRAPAKAHLLEAPKLSTLAADLSALDRILEALPLGNIAFNVPSTVRLGETHSVYLLLSPRESIEELQKEIERQTGVESNPQGAEIRISAQMEAQLTGQNFDILAITPERQPVSAQEVTKWQWDVNPKREGAQKLHLTLNALLVVNGQATTRAIRTFDETIAVRVTLGQRLSGFISNNWQWLWAAVLIPIATGLWGIWKTKRRET